MRVGRQLVAQQIIEISIQSSGGHDATVLTFQRATRGIARIGKERFFARLAFLIESVEGTPRHQHFSADFEALRPIASGGQAQGDGANRAHVGRNIVAAHPIATRQGSYQRAVLIQ